MVAELDSSGGIAHRYVRTDDPDEIVTVYSDGTTASHRWVTNDERDSVLAEADATGALQSIDTYDEYGIPGAANSGRFGYTGQMWLSQPGVYNYKARLYAPKIGFLQTDPVGYGAGMNDYAYVLSDPVNLIDPFGLGCDDMSAPPDGIDIVGRCPPPQNFNFGNRDNSLRSPGERNGRDGREDKDAKKQQQQCSQPQFSTALADQAVQDQINKAIAKALNTPNFGLEEPNQPGVFDVPSHGSEVGFNVLIGSLVTHVGGLNTNHFEFSVERRPPILPLLATVLFIHVHQSPSGEPGLSPADKRLGVNVIAVTPQHATFCARAH